MTPIPTTSTQVPANAYTAIAQKQKDVTVDRSLREKVPEDGSVLFSINGDMMFKLNTVGTLVWEVLEERKRTKTGLTSAEVLDHLVKRLGQCLINPVPLKTVWQDLDRLLRTLAQKDLLLVNMNFEGRVVYRIAEGTFWSSGSRFDAALPLQRNSVKESIGQDLTPGRLMTFKALLLLFAYDLLLKIGGFARVHRILKGLLPLKRAKNLDEVQERVVCARVCLAVERAQTYYIRQALCLQRSVVATCLLRSQGIAAEMIIAAHLMPFKSHAWVEVAGDVVNDSPNVRRYYDQVIERLGVSEGDSGELRA